MPSTKFWSASSGTVTRVRRTTGVGQGCGNNKRLYVGRTALYDFDSYLKFTLDWTGVGKIVSATLLVYTDDQNGQMGVPAAGDTLKAYIRRLTAAFTEGNNADEVFDTSDYDTATATTSDQKFATMAKASGALNSIDITAMVEDWAPSTVKRRDGTVGGRATNHGIVLNGTSDDNQNWSGWSEDAATPGDRPQIQLTYELGPTVPEVPGSLTPTGAVASLVDFEGDFTDTRSTDKLNIAEVEIYPNSATVVGQVVTGTRLWASGQVKQSNTAIVNARFQVFPTTFTPVAGTTYKWRARVRDQEAQISLWTTLISFHTTNTAPVAPVLSPVNASSYASLNGILFRGGTFSDADGDKLQSHQIQMSVYPAADPNWENTDSLLWDTGKVFAATGDTSWESPYGGVALLAGTYYWRARHWDARNGVSAWSYASIILTADFDPEPGTQDSVQIDPHAPWRIVIKGMGALRGPGSIVAILDNAKKVGASIMYNSPGELHFTVPIDHPQVSVIEPKQTHYSLQFYGGDGWREVFAGLVWDYDATERDVIFTGIDYLGLYDLTQDERYDAANPDKPYNKGGSKYVDKTITTVITDQLTYAKNRPNSIVGFITLGAIAAMNEKVTIWSTMAPTLQFVTGLIDSHRQGTGKKTRIKVVRTTLGAYQVTVIDSPGVTRENLRLRYGELVNGYRVLPFGPDWADRVNGIGRTREGIRVLYKSADAAGIPQATWGRIAQAQVFDGISDEADLVRRLKQAAIHAGKLGKNLALGVRSGFLQPRDGYDVCDSFPVLIDHGVVTTANFGSGYWDCYGIAWEAEDDGNTFVTLTLLPREDTTAPDANLINTDPISPQAEWQIGWTAPNPAAASSKYWLDQTTGIAYKRNDGGTLIAITGTA